MYGYWWKNGLYLDAWYLLESTKCNCWSLVDVCVLLSAILVNEWWLHISAISISTFYNLWETMCSSHTCIGFVRNGSKNKSLVCVCILLSVNKVDMNGDSWTKWAMDIHSPSILSSVPSCPLTLCARSSETAINQCEYWQHVQHQHYSLLTQGSGREDFTRSSADSHLAQWSLHLSDRQENEITGVHRLVSLCTSTILL